MGLVFWIDQNEFAGTLVQKVFKKKGLDFYYLKDARDFSYLIDDLNPSLIVIDRETILKDFGAFEAQYVTSEKMKQIPFVAIGGWDQLDLIKLKAGDLPRKLDPFEIPEKLGRILAN